MAQLFSNHRESDDVKDLMPPPPPSPKCQGLLLTTLQTKRRAKKWSALEEGFSMLIGESLYNMGTASSQKQDWPLDPSRFQGVLNNGSDGSVVSL